VGRVTSGRLAAAVIVGVTTSAGSVFAAAGSICVTGLPAVLPVAPIAQRSNSALCRGLAARLRNLAILESNARDTAARDRGGYQRDQAELRLRRNMVSQAGCDLPMSPSDPRARRCFDLKSRLRMAEQRARSRPVASATPSAKLARIRRERQEVRARYRLSGCPQGRVGN